VKLAFAVENGLIRVEHDAWQTDLVVERDQMFEVSIGPQGLEGRILPRRC